MPQTVNSFPVHDRTRNWYRPGTGIVKTAPLDRTGTHLYQMCAYRSECTGTHLYHFYHGQSESPLKDGRAQDVYRDFENP
jgi:hypothetical protein